MDVRPDRPSTFANPQPLSSSLPPSQLWTSNSLAATFRARTRAFDTSPIDDTTVSRRAPATRQLNGIPRPFQRKHKQAASVGSRSTLASQPVVVRTYSADTHQPSTMSQRSRVDTSNPVAAGPSAQIPQVQEFGIEGILRAIDPDIQDTLDAIAEICGRSKLSLANEYGSHRPPLGEIRAPARSIDHGLLTVEEASSSSERLVDDNVIIVGDDISTVDGRDHYSSTYGYLDSIHPTTRVMEYRNSMRYAYGERGTPQQQQQQQQQPESHRIATATREPAMTHIVAPKPTTERNQAKSCLPYLARAFQGTKAGSADRGSPSLMVTQPVISEVHLDAQAEGTYQAPEADVLALNAPTHTGAGFPGHSSANQDIFWRQAGRLSMIPDVHGWLARLKGAGNPTEQAGYSTIRSAETKLRELLERQDLQLMQIPEAT